MFNIPSFMRIGTVAVVIGFALSALAGVSNAAKPEIDPSYAQGNVYYMIGPRLMTNVATTNPRLYAQAEELYLLVYPVNPNGTDTDAKTLPSGYLPQCNPCYHPGLPGEFAYHDHVLTGAPGLGINGTAGENKAPWKIILLMYNPAILDSNFMPITDARDIPAAEAAGEFLPINSDGLHGTNSFEFETGNVLICPLVSPNA